MLRSLKKAALLLFLFCISFQALTQKTGVVGSNDYKLRLEKIYDLYESNEFYECIEKIDDFHEHYPMLGYTWFMRGFSHYLLGDIHHARPDFRNACHSN